MKSWKKRLKRLGYLSLLLINFNYVYAEVDEASSNEFPATVGTVPSEQHEGFVLEWEDGNWSDFVRQLSDATNFEMESVDLLGMFNSEKDNTVAAHDYHKSQISNQSAKQDVASNAEEVVNVAEDQDWRTERKWWQRGVPVL